MDQREALMLTHPTVEAFTTDRAWPPLCDWLLERDVTLADLAVLFAGREPHHEDGLPQEWLANILAMQGREDDAQVVRTLTLEQYRGRQHRPLPYVYDQYDPEMSEQGLFVRAIAREVEGLPGEAELGLAVVHDAVRVAMGLPPRHPDRHDISRLGNLVEAALLEIAVARRDLKRRVLALPCFAGVLVERAFEVTEMVMMDTRPEHFGRIIDAMFGPGRLRPSLLRSVRWRHDRQRRLYVYSQELAAPQLVVHDECDWIGPVALPAGFWPESVRRRSGLR